MIAVPRPLDRAANLPLDLTTAHCLVLYTPPKYDPDLARLVTEATLLLEALAVQRREQTV
jgi:hypothetical protein